MKKQQQPSEIANQSQLSPSNKPIKNENVISAILALLKDLDMTELEFVNKEVDTKLGNFFLPSQTEGESRRQSRLVSRIA